MTLTATKPHPQSNRFKCCLFGLPGVGKSHFAYSFPAPYIIDTEGLMKYSHFVKMINDNGGVVTSLNTVEQIMSEIRSLRAEKHNYKTLVIDSLSPVYTEFCNREAIRIAKEKNTEGTEFAINTAKPKRQLAEMAQLISQIDMNVILISHAKLKYKDGKEAGETQDTPDKFAYMLGAVIQVHVNGEIKRVGQVIKSRYNELKTMESFNLSYDEIKKRFGGALFEHEVKTIPAPSLELIARIQQFVTKGLLTEELKAKWLTVAGVPELKDMTKGQLYACLKFLRNRFPNNPDCLVGSRGAVCSRENVTPKLT